MVGLDEKVKIITCCVGIQLRMYGLRRLSTETEIALSLSLLPLKNGEREQWPKMVIQTQRHGSSQRL